MPTQTLAPNALPAWTDIIYRGLIAQELVGIFVIKNDRLTASNAFLEKTLGYSAEELQDTWAERCADEHSRCVFEEIQEGYLTGIGLPLEATVKVKSRSDKLVVLDLYVSPPFTSDEGERTVFAVAIDETKREVSQRVARLHHNVLSHVDAAILMTDGDGRVRFINPRAGDLLQVNPKSEMNLHYSDVVDLLEHEDLFTANDESETWEGHLRIYLKRAEEIRYVYATVSRFGAFGDYRIVILHDRTDQYEAEQSLYRIKAAIDASDSGYFVAELLQNSMPIIYANKAYKRLKAADSTDTAWLPKRKDRPFLKTPRELQRLLRGGERYQVEYREGDRWYELKLAPIPDEEQVITHIVGIKSDITERIHLEEQLLSTATLEKERVAMELHDSMSGHLHAAAMLTTSLAELLEQEGHRLYKEALAASEYLKEFNQTVRNTVRSRSALLIQGHGFREAVRYAVQSAQALHSDINITLEADESVDQIGRGDRARHVYHIIQAALGNALQHAQASAIHIEVSVTKSLFTVSIFDDGMGFPSDRRSNGIGIIGMQRRARYLSGQVQVSSKLGDGTTVLLICPLNSPHETT